MKRGTPMKRTAFKREGPSRLHREAKPRSDQSLKPKVCTAPKCGREFIPVRPLQVVCSPMCAKRKVMAEATAKRAEHRQRREAIKTIPKLIAEAQIAFNAYIRERDREKGCFVCDRPFDQAIPGRALHAGHVRSRGAAGHLRFHEDNCLGECEGCNGPHGAKPHEIKAGAIRRIGQERFDALEADNAPHKWTHAELRGIRDTYRAKLKELAKQTNDEGK